jgi:hypothetical protein
VLTTQTEINHTAQKYPSRQKVSSQAAMNIMLTSFDRHSTFVSTSLHHSLPQSPNDLRGLHFFASNLSSIYPDLAAFLKMLIRQTVD